MTDLESYSEETKIPFTSLFIDIIIMHFSSLLFYLQLRDYKELPSKVLSEDPPPASESPGGIIKTKHSQAQPHFY